MASSTILRAAAWSAALLGSPSPSAMESALWNGLGSSAWWWRVQVVLPAPLAPMTISSRGAEGAVVTGPGRRGCAGCA